VEYYKFKGNTFANNHAQLEQRTRTGRRKGRVRSSLVAIALTAPPVGVWANFSGQSAEKERSASFAFDNYAPKSATVFEAVNPPQNTTSVAKPESGKYSNRPPKTLIATDESWRGKASYYTREKCLGCHPQRIMANGEPLDDSALTVAFNRAPLGTYLRITNTDNGQSVIAEVTDTGGFEKHGKIADLNLGAKNALQCPDTCNVHLVKMT
jgi:rare lipoprotein A (peptidoglycan hydrolase)